MGGLNTPFPAEKAGRFPTVSLRIDHWKDRLSFIHLAHPADKLRWNFLRLASERHAAWASRDQ
jgi:hypothetical protein